MSESFIWIWDYLYFNIDNGELESLIQGKKNGLLRLQDYNNLSQCDNTEGLKIYFFFFLNNS